VAHVAKRLDLFKGYLGTEMNMRLTKMREEGRDVINLGLGDPDVTPPSISWMFSGIPFAIRTTIITRASIPTAAQGSHRRLVR